MRAAAFLVLLALVPAPFTVAQQTQERGGAEELPQADALPAESRAIRILSPRPGELLRDAFVHVQWELTDPGPAAGAPIYELQLDGEEPIRTSLNEHTFSGLAPGTHVIRVQLVDANDVPVPDTLVQVQVRVPPAPTTPEQQPPPAERPAPR